MREYGEQWLKTREHIETVADEAGRLRNHVFPRIGDLPIRAVRPGHIRDFILDLKKSNVRKRGCGQGIGTAKIAPRTVRHTYSLLRRMFSAAVIDEIIEASPVIVAKGVLPKNVGLSAAIGCTTLRVDVLICRNRLHPLKAPLSAFALLESQDPEPAECSARSGAC